MMTRAEAKKIRNLVKQGRLAEILGGITEKKETSDRDGYEMTTVYIGDIPIKNNYKLIDKFGSDNKPVSWKPYMAIVKGLFYKYKGTVYRAIKSGIPIKLSDEYFVEVKED